MKRGKSHYDYLHDHIVAFGRKIKHPEADYLTGLISAHGDKCYGYKHKWKEAEIPFVHGVAIYLLTYTRPYSKEVRETENGWVDVCEWVIDNYDRFKEALVETFGSSFDDPEIQCP